MWDFILNRDILPHPILRRPCHRWTPRLPNPLGRLERHGVWSRLNLIPLVTAHYPPLKIPIWWVCSATVYNFRTLPSLSRCGTFVLTVTFSLTQSCDALVTNRPLCLPHRWGAWRDIEVKSRLTLIPLDSDTAYKPRIRLISKQYS